MRQSLTRQQRTCIHPIAWRQRSIHPRYELCGKCKALIPAPAVTAPWIEQYDADHREPAPPLFGIVTEPESDPAE